MYSFSLTLKVPEKLQLYGLYVYYVVHICDFGMLRVNQQISFSHMYMWILLKHIDSFGKSENLSKIFFTEILVFDHDYEGKSSSSNGLLWISFIYFLLLFIWIIFRIIRRASEQIYTRYQLYFARCNYYQIVNLILVQSVKVVQKYFGYCLIKYRTSFIFKIFLYQNYLCASSQQYVAFRTVLSWFCAQLGRAGQLVTTITFQFRTSKWYQNRFDVRNWNAIVVTSWPARRSCTQIQLRTVLKMLLINI